jgi:hypothetical protein
MDIKFKSFWCLDRYISLITITILDIVHIVRFEVFTAVAMKNGVFWDVTPCGSCKNRRFVGI